jgi:exonuclease III
MKLRMLLYNVRSLNSTEALDQLAYYLHFQIGQLDVLLLQEHRLRGVAASRLSSRLWKGVGCWSQDASDGYNHLPGELGAGKGGVAILLGPKWRNSIKQARNIYHNRVQWLILEGLAGGDVGIANVYAPNNPVDRRDLWLHMIQDLPHTCRWILAGDFNMVESRQDKTNQCSRLMVQQERDAFGTLKRQVNLKETPRSADNLSFSWDNRRWDMSRLLACMDHFYTFKPMPPSAQCLVESYKI